MRVPTVATRGTGYGVRGVTCDGFDPVAVYETVRDARAHTASGNGPVLVEATCYRFLSHTTDDDDRTYRTRDEVAEYRPNDPVPRYEKRLIERGVLTEQAAKDLKREIADLVNRTTDEIEAEPYPDAQSLYGNTYAGPDDAWLE
jgi:2-oxoisovalerate dehydrogenase E1 component alpha subunit